MPDPETDPFSVRGGAWEWNVPQPHAEVAGTDLTLALIGAASDAVPRAAGVVRLARALDGLPGLVAAAAGAAAAARSARSGWPEGPPPAAWEPILLQVEADDTLWLVLAEESSFAVMDDFLDWAIRFDAAGHPAEVRALRALAGQGPARPFDPGRGRVI